MLKQRGRTTDLPDSVARAGTALVSAFDSAGVPVLITDIDLSPPGPLIRYVNPAFEDITGYAADEVVGRSSPLPGSPLSDQETLHSLTQSLRDGSDFRTETLARRKSGEEYFVEWIISPIRDERGNPANWIAVLRDISQEASLREMFAAELDHRTRNLLATVRSIASRTLTETGETAKFAARLAALARVQSLLSKADKDRALIGLDTLVRSELKAQGIPEELVKLEGAPVALARRQVETLALAIHELAVNALDHGALATGDGTVSLGWEVRDHGDRQLRLDWVEHGPEPLPELEPGRGYGRELIERALPFSLRARTRMEFRPGGLCCRIDLPFPLAPQQCPVSASPASVTPINRASRPIPG